jgi:hypothetical protein
VASIDELDFANGLIFQIRDRGTLVPVLLKTDCPNTATQIKSHVGFCSDLGVDKVAIVHYDECNDGRYTIQKITDVVMLKDGDSTTAKKALDTIVSEGRLMHFITAALDIKDSQ